MTPLELKLMRKAAKLTQAEMAARLGVSRKTVVNWEGDVFAIPVDIASQIAKAGLGSIDSAAKEAGSAHKRYVKRLVEVYREMRADTFTHEAIIDCLCRHQGLVIPPEAQALIAAEFPELLQTKEPS